jgi:glycosyltransferase involved in cell wall biosynthesis
MQRNPPVVSVVMPAYNAEAFIAGSIESVLAQEHAAFELIVVDDGSTDGTASVAALYAGADPRVRLIRCANSGKPSIARNIGIAEASGDYLSFLDSDDTWLPGRLALMVAAMQGHPEWLAAFHDLEYMAADGRWTGTTYLKDTGFTDIAADYLRKLDGECYECSERFFVFMSLKYGAVHTQSIMIDRRKTEAGLLHFDESYVICEDTDLWVRLALCGPFGYLDSVLSHYRQHPGSITKKTGFFAEQTLLFHENNHARIRGRINEAERRAYRHKIAECKRTLAYHYYLDGRGQRARALCREAFFVSPHLSDVLLLAKALIPQTMQRRLRAMLQK